MNRNQIEQQIDAVRANVREVLTQAKGSGDAASYEFANVTAPWLGAEIVGEKDASKKALRVAEEVSKKSAELESLQKQLEKLREAEGALDALAKGDSEPAKTIVHPGGETKGRKSFGELVTEHPTFKLWAKGGARDSRIHLPDLSFKALFETGAGWAPESTRTGFVAEKITRPIQLLDILPMGRTGQAAVVYMEETTRTPGAAGTAEGAQKPQSAYALTERSVTVREIADSIPVTEIQLEDVPMVESYLNGRLVFGIRQVLDEHAVDNGGDTDSIIGLLNAGTGPGTAGGIQSTPLGASSLIEGIMAGMTDVRVNGRAAPSHVLINSTDWQTIRLTREGAGSGTYLWGPPSEAGPARIWGLPIVLVDTLTSGTALVGSFESPWITLFERRGVVVEQGWVNDQFRENRRTLRASGRWALAIYRPHAFTLVEST